MTHFYKILLPLCFALAALPLSSRAAALDNSFVSVGYIANDNIETIFFFGDFTQRWGNDAWSIEIGMFGVVGRLHESYVTATYQSNAGLLSFGFPRPSYDDFGRSALTAMIPRFSLESIGSIRSRTTYGTMYLSKFLPYGSRFSGQTGAIDYTFSLHAVPNNPDVVASGAARWSQGIWTIDLAAEAVKQGTKTEWNTKAQFIGDLGLTKLGLGIFSSKANDQATLLKAFGRLPMDDRSDITGLIRTTADSDPEFGLGLSYQLTSQWTLKAGVFGPDTDNIVTSASLRVEF